MVKLTVRIEVELLGVLRKIVGKDTFSLEFDNSTIVKDVISELTSFLPSKSKQVLIDPELNDPRPNVIILLNKVEIGALEGLDTAVESGDKLVLIPVTHGG
jgi:molybdopterin converting factor small subunit